MQIVVTVVAACLLGSVTAFSWTASSRSTTYSTAMMAAERSKSLPFMLKPSKLDGSLPGDRGFDPLGLSNIDDLGLDLYWLREAELKHARVAMLASFGALAQEAGLVFPGQPSVKNQIDAFWQFFDSNPGPIFAGVVVIGIVEIFSGLAVTEGKKSGDRAPGDFGFNPLNLGKTPSSFKDLAEKEISNGRLAMWAAAGILLQGSITGAGALENAF